uniref:Integrase catalytic domain-containing protein n=1 Tax=Cajanus cajan TaxID=3821 RepID=A0A151TLG1_CAJCA|nr:hypothetical protein KK1_021491 [Cajanus cajan]
MDILEPFPPAEGQLKFLLVIIDYFTKWIEACPLAKITVENVQKFTWKSIGKLAPNWDDPFRVTKDLENGAYRLEELSGKAIPRTWNATYLKFYFS